MFQSFSDQKQSSYEEDIYCLHFVSEKTETQNGCLLCQSHKTLNGIFVQSVCKIPCKISKHLQGDLVPLASLHY